MSDNLIPQHKRLAMGLAVNNEPAGKNMVNDNVKKHASYGIIKPISARDDKGSKSGLSSFNGKK